jgi:hypothetical protein
MKRRSMIIPVLCLAAAVAATCASKAKEAQPTPRPRGRRAKGCGSAGCRTLNHCLCQCSRCKLVCPRTHIEAVLGHRLEPLVVGVAPVDVDAVVAAAAVAVEDTDAWKRAPDSTDE